MTIFYVEKSDLESGLPPKLFSKEEVQERLENLRKTGNLKDDFVFEDQFVPRELTPPVEKKSFPINIAVFGKKKIGGYGEQFYFKKSELAYLNQSNISPVWFKILKAIKDMKFIVPIAIILNAAPCYPAIGVKRIGDNIFSHLPPGSENFILFPEQDFFKKVLLSEESMIREEFVSGLKGFLEQIPKKRDEGYVYFDTGQKIYGTLSCLKPSDIQVVSEE